MSVENVYEVLRLGGVGAATVGLVWLTVALVLPQRIFEAAPTSRAVLMIAAMITVTVAFGVAALAVGLGG